MDLIHRFRPSFHWTLDFTWVRILKEQATR